MDQEVWPHSTSEIYCSLFRIANESPSRIASQEELESARAGILNDYPDYRAPAVTIATFHSEEDEEFFAFQRVAIMLLGRYHLLYTIADV